LSLFYHTANLSLLAHTLHTDTFKNTKFMHTHRLNIHTETSLW